MVELPTGEVTWKQGKYSPRALSDEDEMQVYETILRTFANNS